jgi:hypothetical protein
MDVFVQDKTGFAGEIFGTAGALKSVLTLVTPVFVHPFAELVTVTL